MTARGVQLNWDLLFDGRTHRLNLDEIKWPGGMSDLRAKVHYEVDRRRGVAHTHKVNPNVLEIWAEGARVYPPEGPCDCGVEWFSAHYVTCSSLGERGSVSIGRPRPTSTWPAPQNQPPTPMAHVPMDLEPSAQAPTDAGQLTEADLEALLGPCTCGQSPSCLPECARVVSATA